jgi:cell division septation protein DedD
LAQDDYYYEIQLTNKQLVFYFMAGAAGLILSFLAGVMVGRGVEGSAAGATEARPVVDERVVAEQSPAPAAGTPAPDYGYPKRLESDRPEEGLEPTPAPAPRAATPAATRPAAAPAATPAALPPPPAPRSGPLPKALASTASGFAIQVGAFKDKASADGVVKSLKARGLPAYVLAPAGSSGGLFTVRVGVYRDRADAEAVQDRLRDDKFRPYILKQ